MEKTFETIDEIVNDPYFIFFVAQNIAELKEKRWKREQPKPGFHYKRDWYNRMIDEGNLNTDFFIRNAKGVLNKTSGLSSNIRSVIQHVCIKSFQQTEKKYVEL
jgi:hypothetical protein